MNQYDDVDMLAILAAGARVAPERSRALPEKLYDDPANNVKFQSEIKCDECLYSRKGRAGMFCGSRSAARDGYEYGKRCEFFRKAKK